MQDNLDYHVDTTNSRLQVLLVFNMLQIDFLLLSALCLLEVKLSDFVAPKLM